LDRGIEKMSIQEHPTISEIVEEVKEQICDQYCKYRETAEKHEIGFDALIEKCGDCPLNRL
jgi:hypothetical protein